MLKKPAEWAVSSRLYQKVMKKGQYIDILVTVDAKIYGELT